MHAKSHPRTIFFALILLLFSLSCRTVTNLFLAPQPVGSDPYPLADAPTLLAPGISTQGTGLLTCPSVSASILSAATGFYEDGSDSTVEPEEQYLVTYTVSGDQILDPYFEDVPADMVAYQEDKTVHQTIWNDFTALIPADQRTVLAKFSLVTDGKGNLLAAVGQTYDDPERWALEVDISDIDDELNLTYTLIHEFAHLLTLNPSQVTPSIAIFNNPDDDDLYLRELNACPQYFPGEGCALPDSYINAFFHRFWEDIHAEWQDINLIEDEDAYYQALEAFYDKYQDRFVTDYAATNPEEDIAETFSFFILLPRPAGDTIAEQKILFLYGYPELVSLREQIINSICTLNQ